MPLRQELAGDDGGSAPGVDPAHQALQHALVVMVITRKRLHLALQTHLHRQGQIWVLQTNTVA